MKNIELVKITLQVLKDLGVVDIIVCAGARNAPLVCGLEHESFCVTSYFEERSAAFYGLGLSQATKKPVAIVTTSGTAAVELFPAVVEAHYQNIPLIVITADRPRSYRGTGAPQAIEQAGLFQKFVNCAVDWDVNNIDSSVNYTANGPMHMNLCFDEPLIDGDYSIVSPVKKVSIVNQDLNVKKINSLPEIKSPLVIISELQYEDRQMVLNFLKKNQVYFYAEFLSGFLNHPELSNYQIKNLEGLAIEKFQTVVRIGGVPTHRVWRDLENKYKNIPVFSFSRRKFSGLARSSQLFSLSQLSDLQVNCSVWDEIAQKDNLLQKTKDELLIKYPLSEPALIRSFSAVVDQAPLYIGNSLPIREWDMFSIMHQQEQQVFAHRGANGIDGQISGYLGWSALKNTTWCLVGDLTALYDLSSLGLSNDGLNKRIVVMNNSGGQIFNRLFKNKKYLNSQTVDFSAWATLWGWEYQLVKSATDMTELKNLTSQKVIIELKPDSEQTAAFWSKWDEHCR